MKPVGICVGLTRRRAEKLLCGGCCFFGRSFLVAGCGLFSGCCGFCLSFCCCDFSFLLSHSFCFGFVYGCLCFKTGLEVEFLFAGHACYGCVNSCLTFLFPCFETTLCLFFAECTFLNTTLEMLHQQHTFV